MITAWARHRDRLEALSDMSVQYTGFLPDLRVAQCLATSTHVIFTCIELVPRTLMEMCDV